MRRWSRRKAVDSYRFSNWDRRAGFDRRRGPRRVRDEPVLIDRRNQTDRRCHQRRLTSKPHMPQPVGRFRQAAAILEPGVLECRPGVNAPDYKVLERLRESTTIYSAWQKADAVADGADYRLIRGQSYRRIGSALQDITSVDQIDEADRFYQEECQRAYLIIYGQHPELAGRGVEGDGEVVVGGSANGNGGPPLESG